MSRLLNLALAFAIATPASGAAIVARDVHQMAVAPDGAIYAAATPGVYKSADKGASWAPVPGTQKFDLASVAITAGGTILVLYADTLLKSTDKGATWVDVGRRDRERSPEQTKFALTYADGVLFAQMNGKVNGLAKSEDEGTSWKSSSKKLNGEMLTPGPRGMVYALGDAIYASSDKGRSWTRIAKNDGFGKFDVTADGTFYGRAYGVLRKSGDSGKTWTDAGHGLPADMDTQTGPLFQAADGTLYLSASGRVYKSVDKAASWTLAAKGLPGQGANEPRAKMFSFMISSMVEGSDGALYAGCRQGIYKSTDKGANWKPALVFNSGV